MNDYPQGSVKVDPLTGRWAVRTHFSDDTPGTAPFAWSVADPGGYGSHRSSVEVGDWQDVPPETVALLFAGRSVYAAPNDSP